MAAKSTSIKEQGVSPQPPGEYQARLPMTSEGRYKFIDSIVQSARAFYSQFDIPAERLNGWQFSNNPSEAEQDSQLIKLAAVKRMSLQAETSSLGHTQNHSSASNKLRNSFPLKVKANFVNLQQPNPDTRKDITDSRQPEDSMRDVDVEEVEIDLDEQISQRYPILKTNRTRLKSENHNTNLTGTFVPVWNLDPSSKTIPLTYTSQTSSKLGGPSSSNTDRRTKFDTNIDIHSELMKNPHLVQFMHDKRKAQAIGEAAGEEKVLQTKKSSKDSHRKSIFATGKQETKAIKKNRPRLESHNPGFELDPDTLQIEDEIGEFSADQGLEQQDDDDD